MTGFEIDCAANMQYAFVIDVWGIQPIPRAILRDLNSCLRPHATGVTICKIPWRASGDRRSAKQCSEMLACLIDLTLLYIWRQETRTRLFRVPIFISHPRHSPVNIRGFCFPKKMQQGGPLSAFRQIDDRSCHDLGQRIGEAR